MSNGKLNLMLGFVAGGIAGAATVLIYTPKSGKQMRKDIIAAKDGLMVNAEKYLRNVKRKASGITSNNTASVSRHVHHKKSHSRKP